MKRTFSIMFIVAMMVMFLLPVYSMAALDDNLRITLDLSKVSPQEAQQILNIQKNVKGDTSTNSIIQALSNEESITKYSSMGRAISSTLKEILQTLSTETNSFAKIPVGMTAVSLFIYEIVGKDVIRAVMFIFLTMFLYITIIVSFVSFFKQKKIPVETTRDEPIEGKKEKVTKKTFEYIPKYNFKSSETRVAVCVAHVMAFALITVIILTKL